MCIRDSLRDVGVVPRDGLAVGTQGLGARVHHGLVAVDDLLPDPVEDGPLGGENGAPGMPRDVLRRRLLVPHLV
eukprot:10359932-Alexandrium_andersonii.AAC.1